MIRQRLERTGTEARLNQAATRCSHERLTNAGRRLVLAKGMHRRIGACGPLFALADDIVVGVASYLPRLPPLSGAWDVHGAFSNGEQYTYCMHLQENDADGSVTGHGFFGDHSYSPTFRITTGLVAKQNECLGHGRGLLVLRIRQEARDFVNLCSILLSPDRNSLLEGEWLQVGVEADHPMRRAGARLETAVCSAPQTWGWWHAIRRQAAVAADDVAVALTAGPLVAPLYAPTAMQWISHGKPTRCVEQLRLARELQLRAVDGSRGLETQDDQTKMWRSLRLD